MDSKKLKYIFIIMIVLTLFLSGCSMLEPDTDRSKGRLPTSRELNRYIEKNKLNNIVYMKDLYNKFILLVGEDSPKKYGYNVITSYFGRAVNLCSFQTESAGSMRDFEIGTNLSAPEFMLIRINEDRLSDVKKIVVRYYDPNNSDGIKEINITSVEKYNIVTNINDEQVIGNILDIEVYNFDDEVIFEDDNNMPERRGRRSLHMDKK